MGLFGRKKNTRTIDEQNTVNEKRWKKLGLDDPHEFKNDIIWQEIKKEVKELRKTNADESFIQDYVYSHLPDGQVKIEGKMYFICQICIDGTKFESKDDYTNHQLSNHLNK